MEVAQAAESAHVSAEKSKHKQEVAEYKQKGAACRKAKSTVDVIISGVQTCARCLMKGPSPVIFIVIFWGMNWMVPRT